MTNTHLRLTDWAAFASAIALLSGAMALWAQPVAPQNPSEIVYTHTEKGMTAPKAVYQPAPEYADGPRRKKIQGDVLVSMIVNADGKVRDTQVVHGLDKDLDRKALECVNKWKFDPATKDGQPVAMRLIVQVNFHLY
jgi:TonB family protein